MLIFDEATDKTKLALFMAHGVRSHSLKNATGISY